MKRRPRGPVVRELTAEEREELDTLIQQQREDDHEWISVKRGVASLDTLLFAGDEATTLRDFLIDQPDYSPFGQWRVLMEQHDLCRPRQRYRRKVGWRIKRKADEP